MTQPDTIGLTRRSFIQGVLASGVAAGMAASCAALPGAKRSAPAAHRDTGVRKAREALLDYMAGLDVIDAHEHLRLERQRLERRVDVLTLVSLYAAVDMTSAGLPQTRETGSAMDICLNTAIPLEQRWERVWPYLQRIKFGSYYRPTAIALRDLYGVEDLNETNYKEVSERLQADNTPGIYRRILRDRCRIKTTLVQNGFAGDYGPLEQDVPDLLTPVFVGSTAFQPPLAGMIGLLDKLYGARVADLDGYLEALKTHLLKMKENGVVAFKIFSNKMAEPDMDIAREAFKAMLAPPGEGEAGRRRRSLPNADVLAATVRDQILRWCGDWDWPVCVHCGIWGDYRNVDPKIMLDFIPRYRRVRFDLYHLGMPFVRDNIFIAKNFPNAYLNLCWTYAISQEITRQAIGEILDTVPVNKVFGFGADYIWEVENVWGHLTMARETLADALAARISMGKIDLDDARQVCRLWLNDNPVAFYGLKV